MDEIEILNRLQKTFDTDFLKLVRNKVRIMRLRNTLRKKRQEQVDNAKRREKRFNEIINGREYLAAEFDETNNQFFIVFQTHQESWPLIDIPRETKNEEDQ